MHISKELRSFMPKEEFEWLLKQAELFNHPDHACCPFCHAPEDFKEKKDLVLNAVSKKVLSHMLTIEQVTPDLFLGLFMDVSTPLYFDAAIANELLKEKGYRLISFVEEVKHKSSTRDKVLESFMEGKGRLKQISQVIKGKLRSPRGAYLAGKTMFTQIHEQDDSRMASVSWSRRAIPRFHYSDWNIETKRTQEGTNETHHVYLLLEKRK